MTRGTLQVVSRGSANSTSCFRSVQTMSKLPLLKFMKSRSFTAAELCHIHRLVANSPGFSSPEPQSGKSLASLYLDTKKFRQLLTCLHDAAVLNDDNEVISRPFYLMRGGVVWLRFHVTWRDYQRKMHRGGRRRRISVDFYGTEKLG